MYILLASHGFIFVFMCTCGYVHMWVYHIDGVRMGTCVCVSVCVCVCVYVYVFLSPPYVRMSIHRRASRAVCVGCIHYAGVYMCGNVCLVCICVYVCG